MAILAAKQQMLHQSCPHYLPLKPRRRRRRRRREAMDLIQKSKWRVKKNFFFARFSQDFREMFAGFSRDFRWDGQTDGQAGAEMS